MTREAPGRRGGAYPLWVGVVALLLVGGLWWSIGDEAAEAPVDAGAPAPDASASTEPAGPVLEWFVLGRAAPEASALARCLRGAGYGRAVVLRAAPETLSVSYPGLAAPQTLTTVGERLRLRTPSGGGPRLAAALHLHAGACLREGAGGLADPHLERRYTADDWPTPGATGGLPVGALVRVERAGETQVTHGLDRLGLPELALVAANATEAERALQHAVALMVARGVPEDGRLALPGGEARLLDVEAARAAGWVADGAERWLAAVGDGETRPYAPPKAAPPAEVKVEAAPAPPRDERERAPRRKRTKKPFKPDYR